MFMILAFIRCNSFVRLQGSKMVKSIKGAACTADDVRSAVQQLLPAAAAAQPSNSSESTQSAATGAALTQPSSDVSADTASQSSTSQQPSMWDPPTGKYAKAGATRAFPGGVKAIFWPRMPCLRCGCPWWQGEDWDAKCVRCAWDCEADGYDDDSNPLPKYKAKYDAIVASLKQGKTPEYKAGAKGGKASSGKK